MRQPNLYIIADHALDMADVENCIKQLNNIILHVEMEQYLHYYSILVNQPKESQEEIHFQRIEENPIEIGCSFNGIEICLRKHVVQVRFPLIFRTFADYDRLRIAIYALLLKILNICKSTEIVAYPSLWQQHAHEVKNEWHRKRLSVLQKKICHECTSYKRTKLNLQHCLGKPIENEKILQTCRYRGWMQKKLKMI